MEQSNIRSIVTGMKKKISDLDAERSIAQKTIDMVQKECRHIVSTQRGPYLVCDDCDKVL